MTEYQQDLMILAYALPLLVFFGLGLMWMRYRTAAKQRPPRLRRSSLIAGK